MEGTTRDMEMERLAAEQGAARNMFAAGLWRLRIGYHQRLGLYKTSNSFHVTSYTQFVASLFDSRTIINSTSILQPCP